MAADLDPGQVILDRIAAREVVRAQAEAAIAADMLEFQDLRRRQSETILDREQRRLTVAYAADELSQVVLQAPRSVQCRLAAYRRVRSRLPLTWGAHLAGKIDGYRVQLIASAVDKLRDNHSVIELDYRIGSYASSHTPAQVKGWLSRFVARIEPEAAKARAREQYTKRAVWMNHHDDGMSYLTAHIRTSDAVRIDAILTALAKNKKSDGRTFDQMRADSFVERMFGTGDGTGSVSKRAVIGVVVPIESLAGLTDEPGEAVDGSFALPADMVRDLAEEPGTLFYRILKNPLGKILDITEIGYRPSTKLRRAVEFRDGTCQFATCNRPAVECDLDHQIPWPHGPTNGHNLHALCRRHHQMKTHLGNINLSNPH